MQYIYLTHRDWHPDIHVHVPVDNEVLKVNVETTLTHTPRSNHYLDLYRKATVTVCMASKMHRTATLYMPSAYGLPQS